MARAWLLVPGHRPFVSVSNVLCMGVCTTLPVHLRAVPGHRHLLATVSAVLCVLARRFLLPHCARGSQAWGCSCRLCVGLH